MLMVLTSNGSSEQLQQLRSPYIHSALAKRETLLWSESAPLADGHMLTSLVSSNIACFRSYVVEQQYSKQRSFSKGRSVVVVISIVSVR